MFSRLFPNEAFPNEAKAPGPYLRVSFPRVQRTICISFPLVSHRKNSVRKSSFFLARAEPRVSTEGPVVEPSDLGCVKSGTVGEVFTDHVTRVRAPALASELFPETTDILHTTPLPFRYAQVCGAHRLRRSSLYFSLSSNT